MWRFAVGLKGKGEQIDQRKIYCVHLTPINAWLQEADIDVLDQPFYAAGNIASTGGCVASSYLAAWIIARLVGKEAAREALHYVASVGEKETLTAQVMELLAER